MFFSTQFGWSISFVLPCSQIFWLQKKRQWEIVDPQREGVQSESLDALLSVAIHCVSPGPEDRPTMHRVVRILESEVMAHVLVTSMIPTRTESPLGDKEDMFVFILHVITASPNKLRRLCMQWGAQNLQGFIFHFIYSFLLQTYDN